jgi:hypothetical protein
MSSFSQNVLSAILLLTGLISITLLADSQTMAKSSPPTVSAQAFKVNGELGQPAYGVEDLKFNEFFKKPIGPRGLEPTERLTSLNGRRVRLVGYMVNQELAKPGFFLLTPLPAATTEADDSMADDLPPSTAFVHLDQRYSLVIPHMPELLQLTGVLSVGPKEEADTRVSSVRLLLDAETSSNFTAAAAHTLISKNKQH